MALTVGVMALGDGQQLRKEFPECVISIDTRKAAVAKAAVEAGADIINDASAGLYDAKIYQVAAGQCHHETVIVHIRANGCGTY